MATLHEVYAAATNAYYDGRFAEAFGFIDKILAVYPTNPDALSLAALASLRLEQGETALSLAERILRALPVDPVAGLWPVACALEVISKVQSKDHAQARFADVRGFVMAGAGAIAPGENADFSYYTAFSIARFAQAPEIVREVFRKLYPDAVGGEFPVALSRADTLRNWCAENGAIWGELEPRRQVDATLGAYSRHYTAHAFAYGVVPGGEVLSGWDYAVTGDGAVLYDTNYLIEPIAPLNWFPHYFHKETAAFFHPWPARAQSVDANVLFLSGADHFAVGHWLCDFLPRLRVLGARGVEQMKIALPEKTPRKHRDLLAQFGITPQHIIECAFGRRYKFRNLVVVQPGFAAEPSLENARFLAGGLRRPAPAGTKRTRIFLTRWSNTRTIVNRDEVTRLLQAAGFDFMDLAESSIADQQSRLATADIAMAVYGSDLLSCLFMKSGTDFISLDYIPNEDPVTGALDSAGTGIMCAANGIDFHVLACTPTTHSAQARKRRDFDFQVDCVALQKMIDKIVADKSLR